MSTPVLDEVELEAPAPARRRTAVIAALVTCLVASLGFAGVVTLDALVLYVVVGVLVGAASAVIIRRHWLVAALVGSALGLVWAEVVNLLGGDASGPIARSSLAAAACTAFAVSLVTSRAPATFLVPVAAMVASSMILGGSGEVAVVAVATIVCATATLAIAESRLRRWLQPSPVWKSITAMALVLAAVGLVMAGTQAAVKPGQGTADNAAANPTIAPPWQPTPTEAPTPTASPSSTPTPPPPAPEEQSGSELLWLVALAVLAVAVLVGFLVWRWRRGQRERRLRALLSSGSPPDRAIGAWVWAMHLLRRRSYEVPASLSPDRFSAVTSMSGLSPAVFDELELIASAASRAAFTAEPTTSETADVAWRAVEELEQTLG